MFAQVSDVAIEMGKELTPAQESTATAKIEQLTASIRMRYPDIDLRMASSASLETVVRRTVAAAVARVLRNPDGKIQETIDDYSYRRADAVAEGVLQLTDIEWGLLGPSTAAASPGAFTIRFRG
jgi:DNA-binding transcriptional LysR family regulator